MQASHPQATIRRIIAGRNRPPRGVARCLGSLALLVAFPSHALAQPASPPAEPGDAETSQPAGGDAPSTETSQPSDSAAEHAPETGVAPTPVGPDTTSTRMWVSGRAGGRLFEPACTGEARWRTAPLARALGSLPAEADLLVDGGGLLAPHALTRWVAERDPAALATALAAVGYRAVLLDADLLAMPPDLRDRLLAGLKEADIAVLASNLRCEGSARSLCEATAGRPDAPVVPTADGRRVALVGLLDPAALEALPMAARDGLSLQPPAEILEQAVAAAREAKADFTVALLAEARGGSALDLARAVLEKLPGHEHRPDLLIASGAGDQWLFARPPQVHPALVAPPSGGLLRLRIRPRPHGDLDVLARPETPAERPPEALAELAERFGRPYCERWSRSLGVPLPEGTEDGGAEALLERAADAAREAAHAEVALLETALLEPTWRPLREGTLSASDLAVGLRGDPQLVRATVKGAWLKDLAKKLPSWLHARGLEPGDKVKVAGREVDPLGDYIVVASATVADRLAALELSADWEPVDERGLRSLLLHRYETRPDEPFWNPAEQPAWFLRTELQGSLSATNVSNPGGAYDDAQVQNEESISLGGRLDVAGGAEAPDWGWQGELSPRYRIVDTAGGDRQEADDLIPLRITARYRGLQPEEPRWYVPEPSAEVFLESEFTIPEDRSWRHMLLRPTLGLQWTLTEKLSARLSAGLEGELLDPMGQLAPGLGLHAELKPLTLLSNGDRKWEVQASLDTFTRNPFGGEEQRHTVRAELKTTFDLLGPISFGWTATFYGVQQGSLDWGVQLANQAIVQVGWRTRAVP